MNKYPNQVKEKLTSLIHEMSKTKTLYVANPDKDFTRKRKLDFETLLKMLVSMGGQSIYKELLETFDYDLDVCTSSAFVQQRQKILPCAFEDLMHNFTDSFIGNKSYRGYRLLAADGSDLNIAPNPKHKETYFSSKTNSKSYALMHLNAIYDLCNRLYVDAIIQTRRKINEGRALVDMVNRSPIKDKTIIVADRNYESYNVFANIERKGWNYVIRVKDLSSTGILSGLPLPVDAEFDFSFDITLSKRNTMEIRSNPLFKHLSSSANFDFFDESNLYYPISFRVVRLLLDNNTYETIITNLDSSDFSPDTLKEIYHLRWGIETSFRLLKYSIGLSNFHAKKPEFICQEIFARIIMYNFVEIITSHVVISHSDSRKHDYMVNFTVAVWICRRFLRALGNEPPLHVEALICKNILPIRPLRLGQSNVRKTRNKSAVSFVYRVA